MKKFNYLFTAKGGLLTILRFKENKYVIYDIIRPLFCGMNEDDNDMSLGEEYELVRQLGNYSD